MVMGQSSQHAFYQFGDDIRLCCIEEAESNVNQLWNNVCNNDFGFAGIIAMYYYQDRSVAKITQNAMPDNSPTHAITFRSP